MRRAARLLAALLFPLAALLDAQAHASAPRSSAAALGLERVERLSTATLASALDSAALDLVDEAQSFELGEASHLEEPRAEAFHLAGAELLSEAQHRASPQSYPKTRVWAIDFLGSTLISRSTELSLESHWACGDLSCGIASDGREDPVFLDRLSRFAFATAARARTGPT